MARARKFKAPADISFETLGSEKSDGADPVFLMDSRKSPRCDTDLPAEAFTQSGNCEKVTITNISDSGLRLEGSREAIETLLGDRDTRASESGENTSLEIRFSVPIDSDNVAPVKVHCLAVYARQERESTCQIGLRFVAFRKGRAELSNYFRYRGTAG